jgi:hypothetical protein
VNQTPSYPHTPGGAQFALHRIIDELHQGLVVSTFEHPHAWPAHSQLVWNFEDTAYPLSCHASTFNPHGTEAFEFLPTEACFWVQGNVMYAPGQRYKGRTCLAPMNGLDALVQWAIPKYRGNRQNLRLVYAQPVPNLAQMVGNDGLHNIRHEGVMARVEYGEQGRQFEEEFYACVMWHPPNTGQYNWGLVSQFCFRAERGRLDQARETFWRIATSVRHNSAWQQVFDQVIQQLNNQVMAHLAAVKAKLAGEIDYANKMREYRAWQSDLQQQQFNDRWAADERRNQQVGDILAGRNSYVDPNSTYGNPHHDHTYSRYVWTNGRGRWIHSNHAGYNPNHDPDVATDGYWTLAQQL